MSCVEVAYDLRHAAQYIIASPTEIMGDGFPYGTVAPLFFRETLDPQAICSAFVDHYRNLTTPENGGSASIALIKTALTPSRVPVFAGSPPIFHVRISRAITLLICKPLGLRQ